MMGNGFMRLPGGVIWWQKTCRKDIFGKETLLIDLFLDFIGQSTVDSSTEEWLQTVEENLSYKKWYAGHYQCDRGKDNIQIMFRNVELFCEDRDLQFSME